MAGKNLNYINWDEFFMLIALSSSLRSKDPHNQVGACIVKDNRILATGYNGAPRGFHDDDFPWDSKGEETGEFLKIKNTFVIHAEENAIDNFRGDKKDLEGSTLYVTWFPCNECAKRIAQNGIQRVVYARMYSNKERVDATKIIFRKGNVQYEPYKGGVEEKELKAMQKKLIRITKDFGNE